ncbi:MAG: transketolase [Selenomonadaceae bacterium]|nr:transketolase [Selenomonadaceae bacterium]
MDSEILAWHIRRDVLDMLYKSHSTHIGSAFSIADILAVIYTYFADTEALKNNDKERTRIILSKGHAGAAIYAALYRKGLISEEEFKAYGKDGSNLSCHIPYHLRGIEVSTASLGQGVGMAAGIALAGKKAGLHYRTFAIAGDGECNEGSVWEMVMFARQHKLNNLTMIIDRNGMQALGETTKILDMGDFKSKFEAFDWNVKSVDGHNHEQLKAALENPEEITDKPTCIIANTVKGKGVSFMENNNLWHYRYPQGTDYDNAVIELEAQKP